MARIYQQELAEVDPGSILILIKPDSRLSEEKTIPPHIWSTTYGVFGVKALKHALG